MPTELLELNEIPQICANLTQQISRLESNIDRLTNSLRSITAKENTMPVEPERQELKTNLGDILQLYTDKIDLSATKIESIINRCEL